MNKPVVILESERAFGRTLARVVEAVGAEVLPVGSIGEGFLAARAHGASVILASYADTVASLGALDPTVVGPASERPTLCVIRRDAQPRAPDFARLLAELPLDHFIATPMPDLAEEIALMVAQMLRGGITGLGKYLMASLLEEAVELSRCDEKVAALERIEAYLASRGQERRDIKRTQGAADELLFNALAHAHDAHVSLRYGTDGHFIGLCVRDHAGALDPDTVRASLSRGWRGGADQVRMEEEHGAGLGLFLAHQYLDRLVVTVRPGQATEVIGIVDTLRQPHPPRFASSFHLYAEPLAAASRAE